MLVCVLETTENIAIEACEFFIILIDGHDSKLLILTEE
jgi:hypothetical protein